MTTLLLATGIIAVCFIGFGVGVLFFNKQAASAGCGSVKAAASHEDCPSHKMGICPVEDTTGLVKLASRGRISYPKN